MKKESVSRLIVVLFTAIGCGIQLHSTLFTYFRFQTVTRTVYISPQVLEVMPMSFCNSYSDIFDYKLYKKNKVLKNKIDFSAMDREERHYAIQEHVTIRDIFEYTPKTSDMIAACSIRLNSTRIKSKARKESCLEMFNVTKYYTQEYVCYLIDPIQIDIAYQTYSTTIESNGEVYDVTLNMSISKKMKFFKAIIHSRKVSPYYSKKYASNTKISEKNRHFVQG